MSDKLLGLLAESVCEVFETMSFLDVAPMPEATGDIETSEISITAVICMAGEVSGLLGIHCSRKFAEECAELISGGGIELDDKVLCDTVGELANMIAGTFKRHLSSQLDLFEISLPRVLLSRGHRLLFEGSKESFPRVLLPFAQDEEQKFYIELLYHKR